jgi:TonB family protein
MSPMYFLAAVAMLAGQNPASPPTLHQLLSDAGSDWAVIRREASCSVVNFTLNGVRWTSRPSIDRVALQLSGPAYGKPQTDDPASIRLDGSASIIPQSSVTSTEDDGKSMRSLWIKRTDFERVLRAKRIEVDSGDGRELKFASPGSMAGRLLTACEREQMLEWKVPADQYDRMAQAPVFSGLQFFTTDDYPVTSIRNEEMGTVSTMLTMDKSGAIKSCRVVQSSGYEALDARSCEAMLVRGRGEPALDRHGQPIESYVYFTVRWELPSE